MTEITTLGPELAHAPSAPSDLRVSQIFVARSNFRWRSFMIDREPSAVFVPSEDGATLTLNLKVERGGIIVRLEGQMDLNTGNLTVQDKTRPGKKFPKLMGAMYTMCTSGCRSELYPKEELAEEEGNG